MGKAVWVRYGWPNKSSPCTAGRPPGAEHRSTLVTAGNFASVLRHEKKYAECEQLARQTLAIEERTLGKDHSDTLVSKAVLGQVLGEEGHYPEAERVLREDYDGMLRVVGQDHPYTAESAYDLAVVYAAKGKRRRPSPGSRPL